MTDFVATNDGTRMPGGADNVPPRWKKVFDAIEREKTLNASGQKAGFAERLKVSWLLYSLPGFIFGPFYYFYLRMWRKGVMLIALGSVPFVIEDIFGERRWLNILVPALCSALAKRDYYKLKMRGETIWPFLSFSKNLWTDITMAVAIFVAAIVTDVLVTDSGEATSPVSQTSGAGSAELSVIKKPQLTNSGDIAGYNLVITSRSNGVLTITGSQINRGSCEVLGTRKYDLRFGQQADFYVGCDPIEARIDTNRGSLTFSWPR